MPQFNYKGRHITGEEVTGLLQAADARTAAEQLLQKQIIPIEVKTASTPLFKNLTHNLSSPINPDELQTFARQMYALLHSGLPIVLAIQGLAQSTHSEPFQIILNQIHQELIEGKTLSTALLSHPKIFDGLFVALIRMGENTGQLDDAFLMLSSYLKRQLKISREIKSAMHYPFFILVIIILCFISMNIWIIPKFSQFFLSLNAELPVITQALMNMSNFFTESYSLILGSLLGLSSLGYFMLKQPKRRYQFDRYKIRIPILGSIWQRALLARFSRCFATMLSSGLIITEALSLASDLIDNAYLKSKLMAMRKQLEEGLPFTQSAHESGIFTPMVLQMIAVGEESGNIASLLHEVADFYERELDFELTQLTNQLEPALIIIMSILVAFLALGVYLPMWSMMDALL